MKFRAPLNFDSSRRRRHSKNESYYANRIIHRKIYSCEFFFLGHPDVCAFDESTSTAKEVKVAKRKKRQERATESAGKLVPVKVNFFFDWLQVHTRSVGCALWADAVEPNAGSDWRTLRLQSK